jgi:hypothetical protein
MFLIRLIFLPVRVALGSLFVGYKVGSLVGYRRLVTFGLGVAVGLLLAPVPGRELRARIERAMREGLPADDDDVAERVRSELSRSPRTWHLPQPTVGAAAGGVVLEGEVPHEQGRADLERTAAAVPGVGSVDNRLVVSGTTGGTNGGTSASGTSTTS